MAFPPSRRSTSSEIHGIDDDDDISLNSTDHEGYAYQTDDKEWVVEDLYAERPHPDIPGEMQYLIKWEGFPLDECTWEPAAHLGPGLLLDWEEAKEKIKAGTREPFDVERYNEAYREKQERKRRRNAKRKRLGLLTSDSESLESPTLEDSPTITSRDEPAQGKGAQKMNSIEPSHVISEMKPPDVPKQKVSRIIPPEKPGKNTGETSKTNKKKPPRPPTPVSSSKPPLKPKEAKRRASNEGKANITKTGYQGTARKPSGGTSAESLKAPKSNVSNQKAPASAPKPSSGMPPKITSSLANKFGVKKHTATRTRPQPTAPPTRTKNVFVGGKEPKKRAGLNDVMDDPSKAPKAFNSMRVMNIAKKRGIERNDAAPPSLSSIPQSFIVTNDRIPRPTADQTRANVPTAPPAPLESPPLVQSPTAISPTSTTGALSLPKARKSVRFTEAQDVISEDTPMTDATPNVTDLAAGGPGDANHPPESPGSAKAHAPSRRLSLATYQERGQVQVVAKTAVFGKDGSESVRVVFGGIPRQSQPWLSTFVAQETLHFSSVCASYNFIPYKSELVQEVLSTGAIETNSDDIKSALANIAEHLRRGSYGSHLVTEHFSILVYPSNCDAWDGLNVDKNNSESPLRYMIYKSPIDVRLYPPVSIPRAPARLHDIEIESHCQVLSKRLFGLEFSQFLPQEPREKDRQVFMLLFPRREAQVCNLVKLWLRSCQPGCRIFSNELKDSWAKFHETVRAGAAGTIILHEDASIAIRQLPRLSLLFENKRCYTIWDLATGQYGIPRFPSNVDTTIEPGTLQMTRLFPYGRAFLITPSFALSDPVRLCQFLEWFRNYCANPHFLIMACADFPNYLKAVTLEKAKEHETIYASRRDDPRREEMMAELSLSRTDLEARFRSWEVLKDIIERFGDEEADEEVRKVHWITDFIDPNDEQSLVNWFCWWSIQKCDQYRKFTVLGSSNHKNRAAYRNIEIPVYTPETVGDPDAARILESRRRRTEETALATEQVKGFNQDTLESPGYANTESTPATPASRTLSDFKSEIFKNDSAAEIRRHITAIFNQLRAGKGNWARLHVNPVSWSNVQMADHFGDSRCEYDTFKNWVGSAPMFNRSSNTWYGLFYTIDKEWDAKAPPNTYGRHAWIAAIRPVDPHLPPKTYAKIELFFWDLHACDRAYTGSYLTGIQHKLIDIVKQELPLKDSRFHLEKVHVSSNTYLEFKPSDNPLDVTYRRLQEMMSDGKIWMPPFENLLRERKWISLPKSEWNVNTTMEPPDHPLSAQQHESLPRHYGDEGKMKRSIWHAPRAKNKVEKTKCGNHLYECAMEVRKQNPTYQTMGYQYKSTLDWYHDMKVEGRDASHVNVDSADKILAGLLRKK
ncbi:uncharacterized protein F4807DRAFT_193235 [Annulohypoxylon truncatum]|uniref:uncharacterized protein n=1 Tax=Annulohypoxylon truncatum TaxID=327061 RepID=UPI002008308B|nr:uncharacterized protein F4807DRAFT_193235 [Annulohypoxylon truncatum]KAI1213592.1 hypothetical protein F4807DRAFT_193235 [Annulohypoxylon truncatum]